MKLNEEEQKACDYYRRKFADGTLGCNYCPSLYCKADCTEKEWESREKERRMNMCRKGIPCEYATINGFCQLTACLKHLRERKE